MAAAHGAGKRPHKPARARAREWLAAHDRGDEGAGPRRARGVWAFELCRVAAVGRG